MYSQAASSSVFGIAQTIVVSLLILGTHLFSPTVTVGVELVLKLVPGKK